MAGDEERLFVRLEARVTDFEKRMAQAERRGTRTYSRLRQDSASATRAMETDMVRSSARINDALAAGATRIGALGKQFAAGLAGGIVGGLAAAGISGVVSAVGDVARSVAEVGDEARRSGVSAKAFQEWKFVAEQNRVPIDAMVDSLKELSLRADEFAVTGKGAAAEAFARLGYGAEEVKAKLEDPSALLLEIIGRLGELDKAAQIRIADELFGGTGGERFVELLDQGEAGIKRTIDQANQLGLVMDDELIAKAAEVDRQFNAISNTVGINLKSAIVSAAASLQDFINSFRSFEEQRSSALEGRVNEVIRERAKLLEERAELDTRLSGLEGSQDYIVGQQAGYLRTERDALEARVAELTATENEIIGVLQSRQPIVAPPAPTGGATWTPPAVSGGGGGASPSSQSGGGSSGGSARQRADDFAREAEALLRRTEALRAGTLAQAEINPLLRDFGHAAELAAARTELLLAAQQAGLALTPELRAEVEGLARGYADAAAASAELDEAQAAAVEKAEAVADLRREVVGGFAQDLLDGADAADALNAALGRVADRMLDMALDGLFAGNGGGAGGLLEGLGSLLGFASGTANTGGWRGEVAGVVHGQEAVIPLPSGGKVPVEVRAPAAPAAARGDPERLTIGVNVAGARGNTEIQAMVRAGVAAALREYDARLADRVAGISADPWFRG